MSHIFFDNVTKVYGHRNRCLALQNFTLSLEKGEFLGLVGPNGSGKSTALKMLTNVIFPTAGQVEIDGVRVDKDPETALSGIGSLIDVPGFAGVDTPRTFYRYCGIMIGLNSETIAHDTEKILSALGMEKSVDGKIDRFSKGMKQRIAIGQALLGDPDALVLDEPLSGLDPISYGSVFNMLSSIKNNGRKRTIIMATHNMSEVDRLCDSVAVMRSGGLAMKEAISELDRKKTSVRVRVRSIRPLDGGDVEKLLSEDYVEDVDVGEDGVVITISRGGDSRARLTAMLGRLDTDVYEVSDEGDTARVYNELLKYGGEK